MHPVGPHYVIVWTRALSTQEEVGSCTHACPPEAYVLARETEREIIEIQSGKYYENTGIQKGR